MTPTHAASRVHSRADDGPRSASPRNNTPPDQPSHTPRLSRTSSRRPVRHDARADVSLADLSTPVLATGRPAASPCAHAPCWMLDRSDCPAYASPRARSSLPRAPEPPTRFHAARDLSAQIRPALHIARRRLSSALSARTSCLCRTRTTPHFKVDQLHDRVARRALVRTERVARGVWSSSIGTTTSL